MCLFLFLKRGDPFDGEKDRLLLLWRDCRWGLLGRLLCLDPEGARIFPDLVRLIFPENPL